MKKIFFSYLLLLTTVFPNVLHAQWAKTYGGPGWDLIYAIAETKDGGFVIVGSTENPSVPETWHVALIMKLSPEGDIVWSRSFGGLEHDWASSVFPLDDGGVVVAGTYEEINNDLRYSMILKIDAEGNLVWQRIYWTGGDYNNRVESVEQTMDNGFILLGLSYHEFFYEPDITLTKLNAAGDIVWNKIYHGAEDDFPAAIQQTEDGGFIVAANSKDYMTEERDCWLLRLNSIGDILWQRKYTGGADEWAYDVQQTSDNGFILSGWTKAFGAGETDCWILKILENGDIDWQKAFGGKRLDAIHSVQETDDGGFIVAGATTSFGAGRSDGHITKLTSLGEIQWQRTYGGTKQDVLNDIQETSEGGFIAAGYTLSFGEGERDAFVLLLDSNGNIGSACPLIEPSTPMESTTTGIPYAIDLVAGNFYQWKPPVDLYPDSPSLMTDTLCKAERYKLVIKTTNGGTTDPAPGRYIYSENMEANVEAIPQSQSWRFDRWSGDVPAGKETDNPISIIMDNDKKIKANFERNVMPPQQFTGSKVMNRSLSQREYIHVLSWSSNPDNVNITKYRIYLTEGTSRTLLVELNAQTFIYWHRRVEGDRAYTYALTAVNDSGIESNAVTVIVQ